MPRSLPRPVAASPDRDDAGSIVLGWLVKVSLVLVLVGLAGYDAISVAAAHLRAPDDASLVATTTRDALDAPGATVDQALAAGSRAATGAGYVLGPGDLTVSQGVVRVRLRTTAPTVVISRVPPVSSWGEVTATASARSSHGSGVAR